MKLKVIVKPHLKLEKEDIKYLFGEEFEVSEERGVDILKTTFNGRPVVEYVPSNENESEKEQKIIDLTNKVNELTLETENLKKENKELVKVIDESTTNDDNKQKDLEEDDNNKEKELEENDKNKENKNKKESK